MSSDRALGAPCPRSLPVSRKRTSERSLRLPLRLSKPCAEDLPRGPVVGDGRLGQVALSGLTPSRPAMRWQASNEKVKHGKCDRAQRQVSPQVCSLFKQGEKTSDVDMGVGCALPTNSVPRVYRAVLWTGCEHGVAICGQRRFRTHLLRDARADT